MRLDKLESTVAKPSVTITSMQEGEIQTGGEKHDENDPNDDGL